MEIAAARSVRAHERGVVHRDIKPGNVLITPDGRVKVTDFGIARAGTSEALTQTGSVMGTATYFSPEQAQGLAVDGRSDLYSLGIVLYEAVVGTPPFVNENPLTVAFQHVRDEPIPPSERNPEVPRTFDTVVMVCLQKDPTRRYQTAADVRAELQRFRAGTPLSASVPAAAVTAAVTTVGTGRVFGGGSTAVTPAVGGDGTALPPYARRRSRSRGPAIAVVILLIVLGGAIAALLLTARNGDGSGGTIVVEDVSGDTVDVATATLRTLGFDVGDPPQLETNAQVAEGKVIATVPVAGTRAKRGTVIVLRVSDGLAKAVVPDLANRPIDEADATARTAGFELVSVAEANDFLPPGTVYKQAPAAGTRADKGSKITVTYAKASDVPVPNVVNLDQNDAFKQLTDAGFKVSPTSEQNSDGARAARHRTDPAPNAKVPEGQHRDDGDLERSGDRRRPQRAEPDAGAGHQRARRAGSTSRCRWCRRRRRTSDSVIVQNPTGKAAKGSTVTITVGQASTPSSSTTTSAP